MLVVRCMICYLSAGKKVNPARPNECLTCLHCDNDLTPQLPFFRKVKSIGSLFKRKYVL
jgi:hypothetical protein